MIKSKNVLTINQFKLKEVINIFVIIAIGYLLIGFYLPYQYLDAGYSDWFMHAYRIKSIINYGVSSWTFDWANGMNIWNGYQFIQHIIVSFFQTVTGLSIGKAMILSVVFVFIGLRVMLYFLLKALKIPSLYSLFVTISSYAFSQQWFTISDFSYFLALPIIFIFLYFWTKTFSVNNMVYVTAFVGGVSWLLHPVVAYTIGGLFFFYFLLNTKKHTHKQNITILLIYFLSSLPFVLQNVFFGYKYANPVFTTTDFLNQTLAGSNLGLDDVLFSMFVLSVILWVGKITSVPKWSTYLIFYILFYLAVLSLALSGNLPPFFNFLQISRGVTVIALMIPLVFASVVSAYNFKYTRFLTTLLVSASALIVVQSVSIVSAKSASPIRDYEDPVAKYLNGKDITGLVYFSKVGNASYFTDKVRFVNSYAEHADPHPLAQRLKLLLDHDLAYIGVASEQLKLINSYLDVLGVEYIFLPKDSTLVQMLVSDENKYVLDGDVETANGNYSILKNENVKNAYLLSQGEYEQINMNQLPKPTRQAESYTAWDDEIIKLAQIINSEKAEPLDVTFTNPNKVQVELGSTDDLENKYVLLTQSFNKNWDSQQNVEIKPTATHFMILGDLDNVSSITLSNNWPVWHWPSYLAVPFSFVLAVFEKRRNRAGR